MPTYILSGNSEIHRRMVHYEYPSPIWHICNNHLPVPEPGEEYTVILYQGWDTNPSFTTPSLATLLSQARLVETEHLGSVIEYFVGDPPPPMLFCHHVRMGGTISIIRSSDGYVFLCPTCTAVYAISGLPTIGDLIPTLPNDLQPNIYRPGIQP